MPELPEVEVTAQGIREQVLHRAVLAVVQRVDALRWPIPPQLASLLPGGCFVALRRRGKYLLFEHQRGTLLLHLGMSGHLRWLPADTPPQRHDHFDIVFAEGLLRLHDPRRFGALLWQSGPVEQHPLLASLGPEPLSAAFTADYLWQRCQRRHSAIKLLIMDGHVVVGVGNIYANEALFHAGIAPQRPASSLTLADCARLTAAIQSTLVAAIRAGGSSLRDFLHANGKPGYFQQDYQVYDRQGLPCHACGELVRLQRQGGRASYWCPLCQR